MPQPKKPYQTTLYGPDGKPLGEAPESSEELKRIIQSGQAGFAQGSRVNFRKPDGTVVSLPAEAQNVMQALDAGYQVETSAARDERQLQEEYGTGLGQVGSAMHGAASAVSFGLIDVAGEAIAGDDYTETVKNLKKANPDAHLGGAMTGLLGSFFIPGGQVKAGTTLAKLTKMPRGVAKIGRGVEQATLKALGGAKGGMVRQALAKGTAMGTGAGAEGAVYGAGQWLSESALGETDATAENLLSYMGTGALWGGGAGATLGSSGEILRRGLGHGKQFAKRSGKSIVKMWEKATGNKAAPGLVDAIEGQIANPKVGMYAKSMGAAIGEAPENVAKFTQRGAAGKEARRIATQAKSTREGFTRNIADDLDELDRITAVADDNMRGQAKIKNMGSIKAVGNDVAAAAEATAMIDDAAGTFKGMLDSGDYIGAAGNRLRRAQKTLERHKREIDDLLSKGGDDVGAQLHGKVDSLKREVGRIRSSMKPGKAQELDDVIAKMEDTYGGFQRHLEEAKFYGGAAKMQKRYNAPWSADIGHSKTAMGRKLREKVGEDAWRPVFETNRGAVEHVVNDLGRARNQHMEEFLQNRITSRLERIKAAREAFDDVPAATKKAWDKAEEVAKRLQKNLKEAQKTVSLQNQLGDIVTKSSMLQNVLPMGAGAGMGYLLGGEEGLALGLGLSVFTNPGRMIQMRAALDRMSSTSQIGILKSIKGYIRKATGKAKPLARKMVAPASVSVLKRGNWGDKRTRDKNRSQAYERRVGELTDFLTNPQKSIDRMDQKTAAVSDVAPNVAAAMKAKAAQAARYLYDRAPKPLDRGALLSEKWRPADVDLAKFERIAAVVAEGPKRALESLQAGNLTIEEVDALKDVYPETYTQIVTTLAEQVPELQDKLPYKERIQLSILFDVPVDATMEPGFLAAMHMVNNAAARPTPVAPRARTKTGDYKDLSLDSAGMTNTQSVEMRKLT